MSEIRELSPLAVVSVPCCSLTLQAFKEDWNRRSPPDIFHSQRSYGLLCAAGWSWDKEIHLHIYVYLVNREP
ncbi:hypothetical protein BDV12DRAFT_83331 [Aspergillus spectabilis]